jgi:hypothetical protein
MDGSAQRLTIGSSDHGVACYSALTPHPFGAAVKGVLRRWTAQSVSSLPALQALQRSSSPWRLTEATHSLDWGLDRQLRIDALRYRLIGQGGVFN